MLYNIVRREREKEREREGAKVWDTEREREWSVVKAIEEGDEIAQ